MTQQEAQDLVAKHGSLQKAATAAGVAKATIFRHLHGVCGDRKAGRPATVTHVNAPAVGKGKTLAEFKSQYDKDTIIPGKVRAGLKLLGANGWEYEVQFARMCNVSMADLGNYRDQYADLVVTIRERRAWAGSKAMADKMRAML